MLVVDCTWNSHEIINTHTLGICDHLPLPSKDKLSTKSEILERYKGDIKYGRYRSNEKKKYNSAITVKNARFILSIKSGNTLIVHLGLGGGAEAGGAQITVQGLASLHQLLTQDDTRVKRRARPIFI